MKIRCGRCTGCRLDRSRQWAIRCYHEAQLYDRNCFITLTYDDENLPEDGSLDLRHFQLFMKKLRKQTLTKIRFFHCGEYGDLNRRPHYHALLFNYDFNDRKYWKHIKDFPLYTSATLSELWGKGYCTVGSATLESAGYVARYIMKKRLGQDADDHYTVVDPETGEVNHLKPEYITMSRRPGIGSGWLKRFKTDVFPSDHVVVDGKKMPTPGYYDRQLETDDPDLLEKIRRTRVRNHRRFAADQTPERLEVRATILESRLRQLRRDKL